ncbi:MAG: GNAT family N-acetyltransferase [Calditrichaceae bacterium]
MRTVLVKKLGDNDIDKFIHVIRLFEQVFKMKNFSIPESDHLRNLLKKDDFYVFVALIGDKVVGGLTGYVLEQYYSEKPLAYIFDLAIATEYQRRGIGGKLIAETRKYCTEMGFEQVFVQADMIDDYAVSFYRSTAPTNEEDVIHFYYTLKEAKNQDT